VRILPSQYGFGFAFLILGLIWGCGPEAETRQGTVLNVSWEKLDTQSSGMPQAIEIWEGVDDDLPLNAWFVRVDVTSPEVDIQVHASPDSDGRQAASDFATQSGACVVINGGYFKEDNGFYTPIGLLMTKGDLIHSPTPGIYKDSIRYPVKRSAIGFTAGNRPEIGWVSSRSDTLLLWNEPVPNKPGVPGVEDDSTSALIWNVYDAVEGGPSLLNGGRSQITVDEELFFGTAIPDVHPRTAAGIDENGHLLLMVVDGRQRNSRGVSLAELSGLMKAVGAVKAINLDGGGSSTLIVQGELLNLPTGGTFQREIVSAIGIHCLN
jgi:hypothetical protein